MEDSARPGLRMLVGICVMPGCACIREMVAELFSGVANKLVVGSHWRVFAPSSSVAHQKAQRTMGEYP
jgi:hypothetical protein